MSRTGGQPENAARPGGSPPGSAWRSTPTWGGGQGWGRAGSLVGQRYRPGKGGEPHLPRGEKVAKKERNTVKVAKTPHKGKAEKPPNPVHITKTYHEL